MSNAVIALVFVLLIVVALVGMALSVPSCQPPTRTMVQYGALMPVYGPGKQAILMTAEGPWTIITVLYDGVEIGELVRFNADDREVRYPSHAPDGWRGGAR